VVQLRASRDESRLVLLVAGVAASITTAATRFGEENQLFEFLSVHLVGPMPAEEIEAMVTVLGRRSGLRFDNEGVVPVTGPRLLVHPL
jgi:hypothetical protein